MVIIKILDNVNRCMTNKDGLIIFNLINPLLNNSQQVTVSFHGVDSVTTSFINSAFIELLQYHSFDYIKKNITFSNTTRDINMLIKKRFDFEVGRNKEIIISCNANSLAYNNP
jgi:hypothetical protein